LNTRLPNASVALIGVAEARPSLIDHSWMLLMAAESAADPIGVVPFRALVSG